MNIILSIIILIGIPLLLRCLIPWAAKKDTELYFSKDKKLVEEKIKLETKEEVLDFYKDKCWQETMLFINGYVVGIIIITMLHLVNII